MSATDIGLLVLHAAFAVIIIRITCRHLLPRLSEGASADDAQRVFDIWLPASLAAPAAAASVNTGFPIAATGSLGISIPVAAAMIGTGIALRAILQSEKARGGARDVFWHALIAGAGAGLILLLLAAANRLSIVVGQVVFAIWALLLWFNAPPDHSRANSSNAAENRAALATLGIVAAAILQSFLMTMLSTDALRVGGGVCGIEAAIMLAVASLQCGRSAALRVALWTAVFGMLLSIGLASLSTLLRASWPLRDPEANLAIEYGAAHGYGAFAYEAILLVVIPVILLTESRLPEWLRTIAGWGWIVGGAALIACRLATV